MNSVQVTFPCGDITLEGGWHLPQGRGPFPSVAVCHPHPLNGGNMRTKVVVAICQALSEQSVAAFRFNFRGVGNSGGVYGKGIAEQEDVKAALTFVSSVPSVDASRIGLAGYSFGAGVALAVAVQDERVSLLALVSPALLDSGWEDLKRYDKPKFLIIGDDDDLVMPRERFQHLVREAANPKQYRVVLGADHFWWEREGEVAQEVTRFFAAGFNRV